MAASHPDLHHLSSVPVPNPLSLASSGFSLASSGFISKTSPSRWRPQSWSWSILQKVISASCLTDMFCTITHKHHYRQTTHSATRDFLAQHIACTSLLLCTNSRGRYYPTAWWSHPQVLTPRAVVVVRLLESCQREVEIKLGDTPLLLLLRPLRRCRSFCRHQRCSVTAPWRRWSKSTGSSKMSRLFYT